MFQSEYSLVSIEMIDIANEPCRMFCVATSGLHTLKSIRLLMVDTKIVNKTTFSVQALRKILSTQDSILHILQR